MNTYYTDIHIYTFQHFTRRQYKMLRFSITVHTILCSLIQSCRGWERAFYDHFRSLGCLFDHPSQLLHFLWHVPGVVLFFICLYASINFYTYVYLKQSQVHILSVGWGKRGGLRRERGPPGLYVTLDLAPVPKLGQVPFLTCGLTIGHLRWNIVTPASRKSCSSLMLFSECTWL